MAVTGLTATVAKKNPHGKTLFAVSAYSADASAAELIKAAPAAGKAIYIEHLVVAIDGDITLTLGSGETASAVTTANMTLIGTATGLVYDIHFKYPIKLEDANAFVMDASGAGAVAIFAEGFVTV